VNVPLPQGEFVGYAPSAEIANQSAIGRNFECRSNFGPTAHWCASLELREADPLIFPAFPVRVVMQATQPIQGNPDWVTGVDPGAHAEIWATRNGAALLLSSGSPQSQEEFGGVACCMEPTP
jgi:hypothetical protein